MENPWYKDGLNFKCTGCGQCCTGGPGYVWLSEEDISQLIDHLKISRKEFFDRYTRQLFHRISLKEDRKTYDCVFLKGNRCEVYSARPKQCRTFPWWPEHLSSPEAWKEAAKQCEGINHPEAPVIPESEINRHL